MELNNLMEHGWEWGRRIMGKRRDYNIAYHYIQEGGRMTEMENDLGLGCCHICGVQVRK
jgi:hypothetical protein